MHICIKKSTFDTFPSPSADNYWKKAGSFVSVLRGHSAIVYRDSM